ncbi:MAG: sugar phosphate nucleotidyltransferase [Candidatus Shapirobacteria bacterium]
MSAVAKAVIAAAGRGTRFLPVVKGYAKELVPVLNKPNIQYLVEELLGAGIFKIAIIHRPGEKSIRDYFTPDKEWEAYLKQNDKDGLLASLQAIWDKAELAYYPQTADLPYGNASPVLAAKKFLGDEPFVYLFGDDFVLEPQPGRCLKEMLGIFEKHHPAVVLGVQEVPWEEIEHYGTVKYDTASSIPYKAAAILEKFSRDQVFSNFAVLGRFVISSRIWPVLEKRELGKNSESWLADINNKLAQQDVVIAQPLKHGRWLTTGDPWHWLQTNLEVARRDPQIGPTIKAYLNRFCLNQS